MAPGRLLAASSPAEESSTLGESPVAFLSAASPSAAAAGFLLCLIYSIKSLTLVTSESDGVPQILSIFSLTGSTGIIFFSDKPYKRELLAIFEKFIFEKSIAPPPPPPPMGLKAGGADCGAFMPDVF